MFYSKNAFFQKIIIAVGILIITGFTIPVMALPPEVMADKLLLSVTNTLDKGNYIIADQILEKIKALNVKLPGNFYYQYSRYYVYIQQAAEAKKNLEIYFVKAGKKGKFYNAALKLYNYVEKNEKSWGRFKYNGDGTVTDIQTGLMWAAHDNGNRVNWSNARIYCQNYRGGGYTDWKMPYKYNLDKLRTGEDKYLITPLILLSNKRLWASDHNASGSRALELFFYNCPLGRYYFTKKTDKSNVLPVRYNAQ